MIYFDTSFLAPLLMREDTSERVERFFARHMEQERAVSQWTLAEFSSLLAREVRVGALSDRDGHEVDDEFLRLMEASFTVLPVEAADYELARSYIRNYTTGLRAGDALHLAVASNHRASAIYSLDKRFLTAGKLLGLPVSRGIRGATS